jgi:hypothetical protein
MLSQLQQHRGAAGSSYQDIRSEIISNITPYARSPDFISQTLLNPSQLAYQGIRKGVIISRRSLHNIYYVVYIHIYTYTLDMKNGLVLTYLRHARTPDILKFVQVPILQTWLQWLH